MTKEDQLRHYIRSQGIVKTKELEFLGIPRKHLTSLLQSGEVVRLARGIYADSALEMDSQFFLAQVCKQVPMGIICLLSALEFHKLGTQNPSEVWVAIPSHSHRPAIAYPPIHLVEFSFAPFRLGIQNFPYLETDIRVYSPAKTVVDCFRYRNQIGLDTAMEALKDYLRQYSSSEEIMEYAEKCRISQAIKHYLEALQ